MSQQIIRCGNSNSTYNATPAVKQDEAPRRVTTRMHFLDRVPVAAGFRVVARLRNGSIALLVAAESRAEAIDLVWKRLTDVPEDTVRLMLERWRAVRNLGDRGNPPRGAAGDESPAAVSKAG